MIQYSIYNEWSMKSFEVRVDGVRETSETFSNWPSNKQSGLKSGRVRWVTCAMGQGQII